MNRLKTNRSISAGRGAFLPGLLFVACQLCVATSFAQESDDLFAAIGTAAEPVAMAESSLAGERGREGYVMQLSKPEQYGVISGNYLVSENTGNNVIDGSAFSGASGLMSVIQNTGNHVIIQDSLTLNVMFLPTDLK